ncbi:MAG: GNAT family N-acetyltransferase [Anaerolineales bacterium]|nr:GNAT family N-acetyltransferase [Anaerolineales bacterium]
MNTITIDNASAVKGLSFRHFAGESDYPKMVKVIEASADADKIERADTVEDVAHTYSHLTNCDPYQDMIFAEVNGEVIGYARGWWQDEPNGPLIYGLIGFLAPAWRRKGIGSRMLQWVEDRLREIASSHASEREKCFQTFAEEAQVGMSAMLEKSGYQPVRYFYTMLRPSMDNIPDFPLPHGLEVRPVLPEQYRAIWDADMEAFQDHWGFSAPTEEDYQSWLTGNTFQPHLWKIAWDVATDQVAGQVKTFIRVEENKKFERKRGYTEFISVRRPWRKKGLARALIVQSLLAQKEAGMTESALGVDTENLSGATHVYEDCGFQVVKRNTVYRKSF